MNNLNAMLDSDGLYWARGLVSVEQIERLKRLLGDQEKRGERISKSSALYDELLRSNLHQAFVAALPSSRIVRAVGFYKSGIMNWSLPWHQDRVIATHEKHICEGFKNWSLKEGQWHCEAPLSILKHMFFCRIYIDDSDEESGAMDIAVGSHKEEIVTGPDATKIASMYKTETCVAKAGDVLILPMLTLHKSRRAERVKPRRVIRLDYADMELPSPLKWAF